MFKKNIRKEKVSKKENQYICDSCGLRVIVEELHSRKDVNDLGCCGGQMKIKKY